MKEESILLVGDISIMSNFFNILDNYDYKIEVTANSDEIVSLLEKNAFNYVFVYVNASNKKTLQNLNLVSQNNFSKIFVVTDDFMGNTTNYLIDYKIESIIFYPTKKHFLESLIKDHLLSNKEQGIVNRNKEINKKDTKEEKTKNELSNKNNIKKNLEKEMPDQKGLLEDQIIFDFTNIKENESSIKLKDKKEYTEFEADNKSFINKSEGVAIRPPRIQINTPVSDILQKKERQMRMKNIPEIIVDEDKINSIKEKKEDGFLSKFRKMFK